MDDLKNTLRKYVDTTKKIQEANARVNELRDERRLLELDLAAIYAHPKEDLPDRVKFETSQLMFTMKKPGEWKKGWTLSKKQLAEYVMTILPEHGEDLMSEIMRRHEPKLVGTDFAFDIKPISGE